MAPSSLLDPSTTVSVGGHWQGRPFLARLVRLAVTLLPIVTATASVAVLSLALPQPSDNWGLAGEWLLILTVASVLVLAARRMATWLLPLSALLELTLVFPDVAPSRTATALRTPSDSELRLLVERTRRNGLPPEPAEAAQTILTLVGQLSRHDRLTRGHSERVRVYAGMIAQQLKLPAEEISRIQWAGLLHDIGKLSVDESILNKPGRLTEDEYTAIKLHAAAGAAMVEPLRGWLGDAVDAVGEHHERWDGGGYPRGLSGHEISLPARIIAVADVFDVITARRSYKEAFTPDVARQEIADCAGTQFDPRVVRAFLSMSLGSFRLASGPLAWLAQLPVLASLSVMPAVAAPTMGAAAVAATVAMGTVAAAPMVAVTRPASVIETVDADADILGSPVSPAAGTDRGASTQTRTSAPSGSSVDVAATTSTLSANRSAPSRVSTGPVAPTETSSTATAPSGSASSSQEAAPTTARSTDPAGILQEAAAAEKVELRAQASAELAGIDADLADDLAKIQVDLRSAETKAHATWTESTADARTKDAKTAAAIAELEDETRVDIADEGAKRDAKLAALDADLGDDLAKVDADEAKDLADAKDQAERNEITAKAAAKRADLRADHAQDTAKARADHDDEVADLRLRLADAKAKRAAEFAERTAHATTERDDDLRKARDTAAEDTASKQAKAAEDRADITEDLASDLDKVDRELAEDLAAL